MKSTLIAQVAAIVLFSHHGGQAAEIKLLAAGATKEIYLDLIPTFEKSSGHQVVATWAGTVDIKKKVGANEEFDLVIVGAPEIDTFMKEGKIAAGSRADLMKSGVGIAVRAGAPKPDVGSSAALKQTLMAAKTIGYSTGPSGVHLLSLLERMGISDQVKPKLKQVPPGARIGTLIANGDVEIGFQQISELIHEPGVDYVGPLPADLQNITVYAAGIPTTSHQAELAKALIKHLGGPSAASAIRNHGMEPN